MFMMHFFRLVYLTNIGSSLGGQLTWNDACQNDLADERDDDLRRSERRDGRRRNQSDAAKRQKEACDA